MRDGKARVTRHVDVDLHIWPRIEDRPDAFIIVAQQIRKLRDSFSLNRFKNERHRVTLRRNRSEVQLQFWGAQACQPAVVGSLPTTIFWRARARWKGFSAGC